MSQIVICIVTNKINDKSFVFKSKDSTKRWDRFKKQLDNHLFYNKNFQDDWTNYGSDSFFIEVKSVTETDIDKIFINTILSINKTYNETDFNNFRNKPLDSTINKLKNSLDEKITSSDFKIFSNNLKLDESDISMLKQEFAEKIELGEINYNNFDEEFENLLKIYSKKKEDKLNNEKLLSLLLYSSELNNSNLDKIHLNNSDISNIQSEIQKRINKKELNSKKEVLSEFRRLSNKKYEKNTYKNKCYSSLNNLIGSSDFRNTLKTNNLSNDDAIIIKNNISDLIDKDEIGIEEIEYKVNEMLKQKSLENKKNNDNLKEQLKENAFKIIGKENINSNFKNRLRRAYLHENVAYVILVKILRSINIGEINSNLELNSFIDNEIKQNERKDVISRLKKLSSNELNILLKKNNIQDLSISKSSKISKLINSTSCSILRNDIRSLGYHLNINNVENPYVLYCPECGVKVSIDEEDYCSNCGHDLINGDDQDNKKNKRILEFILTLIAFILTIFGIIVVLFNYEYYDAYPLDALLSAIIGIFGAIIIRNYPKIGAIFAFIAGFIVILSNIPFSILVFLFYVISAVLCFARK